MTASLAIDPSQAFSPASVAGGVRRTEVLVTADGVHWLEHSFDEGCARVMRAGPDGLPVAVTPPGVDVGTLAWEYGAGSYLVTGGAAIYADRDDQRLYRVRHGASASALTPAASEARSADRFADGCPAPDGRWAAYVCESRSHGSAVRHSLVAIDLKRPATPRTLTQGADFYASPQISPDGRRLSWISWCKPRMPWDGTELWVASVRSDLSLTDPFRVAGGLTESVLQPSWSPEGTLHWVSDRSGWWNLYALVDDTVRALCPERSEFAVPPWQFGRRSYGFLSGGAIAAVRIRDAIHDVVRIDPGRSSAEPLSHGLTQVVDGHLSCHGQTVALIGASATRGAHVLTLDVHHGRSTTIVADPPACEPDAIAVATPIRFPDVGGEDVHGFWYEPPATIRRRGPLPLVLQLHGGPTDAAVLAFDDELQLWTSRGHAVLDLNYSGSSGFGSAYRHRLDRTWGTRDLADCVTAVEHLAREGLIDPARVLVRGASAGGYLTLRCVTATSAFRGGLARCAISDLGRWRQDAHDFESRYTDMLVGPASSAAAYRRRSPARGVGARSAPLLLVHGLADTVVPPGHSSQMAEAYRRARRPHRLELLDGEPHGLRRAESRKRWLAAELAFAAGPAGV
jgi:dipeptidyl aminopeptidase/acylaminoacyl peptidase